MTDLGNGIALGMAEGNTDMAKGAENGISLCRHDLEQQLLKIDIR